MELSVDNVIKKPFSGRIYDGKLKIVLTASWKVHTHMLKDLPCRQCLFMAFWGTESVSQNYPLVSQNLLLQFRGESCVLRHKFNWRFFKIAGWFLKSNLKKTLLVGTGVVMFLYLTTLFNASKFLF